MTIFEKVLTYYENYKRWKFINSLNIFKLLNKDSLDDLTYSFHRKMLMRIRLKLVCVFQNCLINITYQIRFMLAPLLMHIKVNCTKNYSMIIENETTACNLLVTGCRPK